MTKPSLHNDDVRAIARMLGLPDHHATLTYRGLWDLDTDRRRLHFGHGIRPGVSVMQVPSLEGIRSDDLRAGAALIRLHIAGIQLVAKVMALKGAYNG